MISELAATTMAMVATVVGSINKRWSTNSLLTDLQLDQPLLVIKDAVVNLANLFFKFDLILKHVIKLGWHGIDQIENTGS